MTQDEIIELTKEVYGTQATKQEILFAKLVAEKEREACAKVCETLWDTPANGMATEDSAYGNECATAIRARGQK